MVTANPGPGGSGCSRPGARAGGVGGRAEQQPAAAVASDLGPGESVEVQVGDTPIVIRRKLHIAEPMSIDEALYEMELIGHDFFLFVNKETGRPSVVYHRHGWSYGVFEIDTPENVKKA